MGFALIRPASRPEITAAGATGARPADADRAAAALRADYERWSRWGLGVGAFVAAMLGSVVTVGMISAIAALPGPPAGLDLVVLALAAVVGIAGLVVLVLLWVSGRRILSAATWWLRLPYTEGWRQRRAGGWLGARTVNFEPRVFVRILSATLALLIGIAGVVLFIRDVIEGVGIMSFLSLTVGLIGLLSGLGQLGGVMRLVLGMSEADPLWVRVRSGLGG
ncbi:MAG: hypothetical protein ACQEW8_06035 [Actinomycetota bacterium]